MKTRARLLSVLAILAGGGLALIASTQTWIDVELSSPAHPMLVASGAVADPLLAPLSLAALALTLALTIVGRVLRYLLGAVALVLGAAIAVAAVRIGLTLPVSAYAPVVTEATGLRGTEAVAGLVASAVATPWPAFAAVAGVLIVLGGALALATAHLWRGAGRRYRTDDEPAAPTRSGSRPHDAIDSWDDLSRGDDPTAR